MMRVVLIAGKQSKDYLSAMSTSFLIVIDLFQMLLHEG
jgi:hypothetical protein